MIVLLVAGRGPLHTGNAKMSVPATEPPALPVFELTAGAEAFHLQPVEEERQAEWETTVPTRHKVEHLYGRETKANGAQGLCILALWKSML